MNDYKKLLEKYPEHVTKEQFRLIAHISKNTARYLLLSGIVPCVNTGKKTRNYRISMEDIVDYLRDREVNPEIYRPINSDYVKQMKKRQSLKIIKEDLSVFRRYLKHVLKPYQDAMTVQELSEFMGYEQSAIIRWCASGQLKAIYYRHSYRIPKTYFIAFLAVEGGLPFTRYSVQYKQLIENFYVWKLNKNHADNNNEEEV